MMLLIGYILPFFITLLPLTTKSYGEAEGWCWLKPDEYQLLWRIGSFYAILVVIVIFNIWSYWKITTEINYEIELLESSVHEITDRQRLFKRFSLYPLVIVICYFPILCKRIYDLFDGSENLLWLTLLAGAASSLIGFLNAIVYGLTNNVKDTILDSCRKRSDSSDEILSMNSDIIDKAVNVSQY